jgi:hypothetical protein
MADFHHGEIARRKVPPPHRLQGTPGFTSFGIENLKELIEMHKADPAILKR